jgi:6-pyruvoyltetrahydropterin/6-carboxytetrahydropterin synthase
MEPTLLEVGIVAQFEAAHRLQGDFGPAARLHGHTYRVEVGVRGESLQADGTLCDITLIHGAVDRALKTMHYRDLNALELFQGKNTTAETVAQVLLEQIIPDLEGRGLSSLFVRVWESPQAYAAYEREL